MKILYVIHEFFPSHYTGTARVGLNLAKQMQKMGHEVKVLAYEPTETDNMTIYGNILYKKYEYDTIQIVSIKDTIMSPEINFDIFNKSVEKNVRSIIELENLDDIDIVHIIHPLRMGIVAKILKEKKIPIILTLTDYWTICPRVQLLKPDYSICNGPDQENKCFQECAYSMSEIKNRLKDASVLFNLADIVTVPSQLVRHVFNSNGFDQKIIQIVNHGLDYKYFTKMNTKFYSKDDIISFGYIGPVFKHKGLHILIDAFKRVKSNQIRLKIYGSYFHEKNYYDDLRKISNDDRISFMGEFNYDNLSNVLKDIDMIIIPSICYETYCLALTESLAHNVPVIASKTVGSAIEFRESTLIFNNGDELTEIIEKFAKNPMSIKELKKLIIYPPMIEEEALYYESMYNHLLSAQKKK